MNHTKLSFATFFAKVWLLCASKSFTPFMIHIHHPRLLMLSTKQWPFFINIIDGLIFATVK
jgi:hypothetical protein